MAGIDGPVAATHGQPLADAEAIFPIDHEGAATVSRTHIVTSPQGILEESLYHVLLVDVARRHGIHEVGVVHEYTTGLLGERVAMPVHDVDESGITEVLDVVHHGGPADEAVDGQLRHVGCTGVADGQHIEKFLDTAEVFLFDLLDEEDIHLYHHVHDLKEVLREIRLLQEEWIIAVVQVAAEMRQGIDLSHDLVGNVLVAVEDLAQGIGTQVQAQLQVQVLAEGKAAQVVAVGDTIEFGVLLLESHHTTTGEDDMQAGAVVVDHAKLMAPILLFEYLVDEQGGSARSSKLASKLVEALALETEVVHVDVEATAIAHAETLLGILKQEGGLAYPTASLDADEAVTPVYFVHQCPTHRCMRMLEQILVCTK